MMYAVIDVETTGARAEQGKITEIAIVLHDGTKCLREFSSLVNPECAIPPFITQMTGISNDMVKSAPKFYEIAKQVLALTNGQVFVGHNVNFDYAFVKKEFAELGYDFKLKTLCTLRLSRKLLPKQASYRLGALASYLNIAMERAHRALDDAKATAILLEHLLESAKAQKQEATLRPEAVLPKGRRGLPPQLDSKKVEKIPEVPGVYYFYDRQGVILYIGKSKNLKKRVMDHLCSPESSGKRAVFLEQLGDLSFEVTGSELVAELMEAGEIKKHKPYLNRRQKRRATALGLFAENDASETTRFVFRKMSSSERQRPLTTVGSRRSAEALWDHLVRELPLDPHACKFENQALTLSLPMTAGEKKQRQILHQAAAQTLIERYTYKYEDAVLLGKGRHEEERTFVLIEKGVYQGFGFIPDSEVLQSYGQLRFWIQPQEETRDVKQILLQAFKKNQRYALFEIWQESGADPVCEIEPTDHERRLP